MITGSIVADDGHDSAIVIADDEAALDHLLDRLLGALELGSGRLGLLELLLNGGNVVLGLLQRFQSSLFSLLILLDLLLGAPALAARPQAVERIASGL